MVDFLMFKDAQVAWLLEMAIECINKKEQIITKFEALAENLRTRELTRNLAKYEEDALARAAEETRKAKLYLSLAKHTQTNARWYLGTTTKQKITMSTVTYNHRRSIYVYRETEGNITYDRASVRSQALSEAQMDIKMMFAARFLLETIDKIDDLGVYVCGKILVGIVPHVLMFWDRETDVQYRFAEKIPGDQISISIHKGPPVRALVSDRADVPHKCGHSIAVLLVRELVLNPRLP